MNALADRRGEITRNFNPDRTLDIGVDGFWRFSSTAQVATKFGSFESLNCRPRWG
jgi:hypothetical protein